MFSLAVTTPAEATRANTSVPRNPASFLSTFGSDANRLPLGVPLPNKGMKCLTSNRRLRKLS